MKSDFKESMSRIDKIATAVTVILSLILFGPKIFNWIRNWEIFSDWSLIICESKLNDAECFDNSYTIPGYKDKHDCLEAGLKLSGNKGFECGKNCRQGEFSTIVCNEICNKRGCS